MLCDSSLRSKVAPTELPEAGRGRRPVTRDPAGLCGSRCGLSSACRHPDGARGARAAEGQVTRPGWGARPQDGGRGGPAREGPCHRPAAWRWARARSPHTGEARARCRAVHRPAHRSGPQETSRQRARAPLGRRRPEARVTAGHGEPFAGSPSENRGLHASKTSLCPAAGVTAT